MIVEVSNIIKNPLVSVYITTYNHERYLRECLDSVISQECDFPYEVVIGEDKSTDGTRAICLEYQAQYPNKIRLLLHDTNQGLMRNLQSMFKLLRGKYLSACSGDDYWCDKKKLQKQVDFMEAHAEYGVVFAAGYDLCDGKLTPHAPAMGPYHNGDVRDICVEYTMGYGSSLFYCKELLKYVDIDELLANGIGFEDYVMYAIFSMHTQFAFMEDRMSVYRIVGSSISHTDFNVRYMEGWANTRKYLKQKYPDVCHFDMDETEDRVSYTRLKRAIFDGNYTDAVSAKNALKTDGFTTKKYAKALKGRMSFWVLRVQMRLKALV